LGRTLTLWRPCLHMMGERRDRLDHPGVPELRRQESRPLEPDR
jgi:hypothetical protein